MPNIGLMREVLGAIRKAPNAYNGQPVPEGEIGWDQMDWHRPAVYGCGTACCFAGWVAELDPDARWADSIYVRAGGEQSRPVWDYAQDRLGLSDTQGDWLFAGGNTLEDLESIIDQLEADPSYDPDYEY